MNEEHPSSTTVNQSETNEKLQYLSPIKSSINPNPHLFTEDKGISSAFLQMMNNTNNNNNSSSNPVPIDRNQLFETFLLFQQFINTNSIPQPIVAQNQFSISKSSERSINEDKEPIELEGLKDKAKPNNTLESISVNKESNNDYKGQLQDILSDSSRNIAPQSKPIENNNPLLPQSMQGEMVIKPITTTTTNVNVNNNYDDMPIKTSNANFMELFEKSLANDQPQDNSSQSHLIKKKINKPISHPKRTAQISKTSKTEKKYFYYTDKLDENANLIEDKKAKPNNGDFPSKYTVRHSHFNELNNPIYRKTIENDIGGDDNSNIKTTQRQLSSTKREEMEKKVRKSLSTISSGNNKTVKPFQPLLPEKVTQSKKEPENEINNKDNDYYISNALNDKPNDQYDHFESDIIDQTSNQPEQPQIINEHNTEMRYHQDYKDEPTEHQAPQMSNRLPMKEKKENKEQIIERKILELNAEIMHFKEEKDKVNLLKIEYEKLNYSLKKDIDELNARRTSFEEWREEELKKIQKERKKLSQEVKQVTTMRQSAQNIQLLNKKDKEQVEALKNQMLKMQSEFKQKDNTNKLIIDKLKKQIEELSQKKDNVSLILHQPQLTSNTSHNTNERARSNSKTATITSTKMQKSKTGRIELKNKKANKKLQNLSNSNIYINGNQFNNTEGDEGKDGISSGHNINIINNYSSIPKTKEEDCISNGKVNKAIMQQQQVIQPQPQQHQQKKQTLSPNKPTPSAVAYTNNQMNSIYSLTTNEDANANANDNYDFILPEKYHSQEYHLINQETSPDGKIIRLYNNDKREVIFQSGVRKEIYNDGYQIVYFSNGDLKQVFPDNKSVYYFKDAKTVQTTFGDGQQVFKFNNGQIEKHFIDGTKRITFPDGSIRYILKDGSEETYYSDGTIQKISKDNVIVIEHQDGFKEIKYPDGKEECIYPEDRYQEDKA